MAPYGTLAGSSLASVLSAATRIVLGIRVLTVLQSRRPLTFTLTALERQNEAMTTGAEQVKFFDGADE